MSSPLSVPPTDFDEPSRDEQVELAEKPSDYVSPYEYYVDIPEWHRKILDKAMARYEAVGIEGRSWEEIEQELIAEGLIKAD
jgi:hypothetical protein